MPIYMDRHYLEGATKHAIANAHESDLRIQDQYDVNILTYWFDEERSTAFCLVDAPDEETIRRLHAAAHGSIPHEIIPVDPATVQTFLGRIEDPLPAGDEPDSPGSVTVDSAFRTIMFTDLKDSTAMTGQFGDTKAMHLLRIHNALTRDVLRAHNGREVKHTGDGFMLSFAETGDALGCAMEVQAAFSRYNEDYPEEPLHVRIGLSAGEPIEEGADLFGSVVQLGARICAHAEPDQILAAQLVCNLCPDLTGRFLDLGDVSLKGFQQPVRLFEVRWQIA